PSRITCTERTPLPMPAQLHGFVTCPTSTRECYQSVGQKCDRLVDISKDGLPMAIDGSDPYPVAGFEKGRASPAILGFFGRAGFGNTGKANAIGLERQGLVVRIGHSAAANNRARPQIAGARGLHDQICKIEMHAD